MRRRDFVKAIVVSAAAWPLAACAQQGERVRQVAVLMGAAKTTLTQKYVTAFLARLEELGWKSGRNLRTDVRWWAGREEQMQPVASDMLGASPDIVVAFSNLAVAVL